jgi:predicted transcriptional regulator
MEASREDDVLISKVKAIVQGAEADLLRRLVDILYERSVVLDEYDSEPLTPEDIEAIQRGKEDIKQGRVLTLEEYERKYGL